jgi:hypothetical protein
MKRSLFWFINLILIVASWCFLLISDAHDKPAEYLGSLFVILMIVNLIFTIAKGWGTVAILGLYFGTLVAVLCIGTVNIFIDTQIPWADGKLAVTYGVRWISLFWPIAAALIGDRSYPKKEPKTQIVD